MRALARAALASVLAVACQPAPEAPPSPKAVFGVFFGGQIQERREIPFELSATKQTLGFRVEFGAPLSADTEIDWRFDRPRVPPRKPPRHAPAVPPAEAGPITGKGIARAGEARFERSLSLAPGDPLGLWNVRVVIQGKVALDRPFELFDPVARARAGAGDGGA